LSAHVYGKPVLSVSDFLLAQAMSRIGGLPDPDPKNVGFLFDDLTEAATANIPDGWVEQLINTGATTLAVGTEGGGVSQLSTGVGASSNANHTTKSPIIRAVGTVPWYFAGRMKITTAVTAQSTAATGLLDVAGTKTLYCGFIGGLSAVNFGFQYDGIGTGTFLNTGVAVDTNWHVFEIWGLGDGKLHAAFDFGADLGPVTMSAAPAGSVYIQRVITNGTDAVARTALHDYVACLYKRT